MGDPSGAAHLTGTLQNSPSVFELLAADNFSSALRSAIRHVAKFVASRSPERLGVLYRNFDELFLILDAALQLQYLKTKRKEPLILVDSSGATLSEAFYGLERTRTDSTRLSIFPSLFVSAVIPYCRNKLKKLYETYVEEGCSTTWKKLFVKSYPVIIAAVEALKLLKYILYCVGKSCTHDFILDLLGLRVGYANPMMPPSATMETKPLKWFLLTLGESVLWVVEIGSFFVQFLEAYSSKRGSLPTSLPTPEFYQGSAKLDPHKCPLCNEKRKTPATLSTSGVTFCYTCIAKYLKKYNRCPVTAIPSDANHIIRIFYT